MSSCFSSVFSYGKWLSVYCDVSKCWSKVNNLLDLFLFVRLNRSIRRMCCLNTSQPLFLSNHNQFMGTAFPSGPECSCLHQTEIQYNWIFSPHFPGFSSLFSPWNLKSCWYGKRCKKKATLGMWRVRFLCASLLTKLQWVWRWNLHSWDKRLVDA